MNNRRSLILAFIIAGVAALFGSSGCKRSLAIKEGMTVKINYTLTVDGKVIDTSQGKAPLAYVQGNHMIIPGLEEQLVGLNVGDKKQVKVSPEKGYGQIDPNAIQKVPAKNFGDRFKNLKVGSEITGHNGSRPMRAKVLAVTKTDATLDMNHPLAGKTLIFDIEVVEINPAPPPHT